MPSRFFLLVTLLFSFCIGSSTPCNASSADCLITALKLLFTPIYMLIEYQLRKQEETKDQRIIKNKKRRLTLTANKNSGKGKLRIIRQKTEAFNTACNNGDYSDSVKKRERREDKKLRSNQISNRLPRRCTGKAGGDILTSK